MKIFISGGCKNGKSTHAQALALGRRKASRPQAASHPQAASRPLYYIATMTPGDEEDQARIARHVEERRGLGFETVEIPRGIETLLEKCDCTGSFLLDSLTALLANEMFSGGFDPLAPLRIREGLGLIFETVDDIVLVSDYIYSDAWRYDEFTTAYRRGLSALDIFCAQSCDRVLEACCGMVITHK
ncbi:MAG: bifunctional adenosylcobinamide kinase/adenosylcobinamide-phosphate guanylyltransferase [Clostridiales bacterium]|jgi:adenosylcobinamide kinase/adenosylcobinamide-phosphate guanylyltransferase|nr:bifunctional adenosylcobinamide kinase/adenosylcobinamide-phosphate guanylyltransferase [Clostridiales bacterium]